MRAVGGNRTLGLRLTKAPLYPLATTARNLPNTGLLLNGSAHAVANRAHYCTEIP